MEWKHLVGGLAPSASRGMATHVAWIAKDFGRRNISLFSPADVDALARTLASTTVAAGQRILSPGAPADAAYIVESGEVELRVRRGAHRSVVGIQRTGGVFGDVPLLCDIPFPFAAVARVETTLLRIEKTSLVELLTTHPTIALRWMTSVVRRLEHANRRIVQLTVGDLSARMIVLLASEIADDGHSRTEVRLTQSELAALLGASRQQVNRVLRELVDGGLLRQQYGGIEVLDPQRLIELAGVDALAGSC